MSNKHILGKHPFMVYQHQTQFFWLYSSIWCVLRLLTTSILWSFLNLNLCNWPRDGHTGSAQKLCNPCIVRNKSNIQEAIKIILSYLWQNTTTDTKKSFNCRKAFVIDVRNTGQWYLPSRQEPETLTQEVEARGLIQAIERLVYIS